MLFDENERNRQVAVAFDDHVHAEIVRKHVNVVKKAFPTPYFEIER
ncbi:uncharacterized protein Nmag_2764 [Natrialba magadii ATCC 43099]|uniref:Uncharacterized protein n=1 Tax=Natrialba magadii (strain ATCC 43099 / DSM 3394 / CCM 3739 / CIP 104546 / IAM 13178 / JCM 8861 / NBRC 102185 / NCIMB 2190 / MS3) TaxID=547559 RepID=D3SZQ9_NATMM|nr:uncharacterized protein Nmag_2764 [Natrialba magadii ATCC 43099]